MDQFKSILKILGFWLASAVAVVFGTICIIGFTERGGLGSVGGWVLAVITLALLVFLFFMRRRSFWVTMAVLTALSLMIAPARIIAALPIGESVLGIDGITGLSIAAVLYFLGAYLITRHGFLKVIGVLLILAISLAGALVTTGPDYARLVMVANRVFWGLMAGMGIFMVMRRGLGLRLLGVSLVVLALLSVMMALFSYASSTAITGKDRAIILVAAEPRINNLFRAWNDEDYQKESENFNDEMRKNMTRDKFLADRGKLGKLISKDKLTKLAPKSDSPSLTVKAKFIKVMYGVSFEKSPADIYLVTVYFQKYDDTYSIGGLTFDLIAQKTTL